MSSATIVRAAGFETLKPEDVVGQMSHVLLASGQRGTLIGHDPARIAIAFFGRFGTEIEISTTPEFTLGDGIRLSENDDQVYFDSEEWRGIITKAWYGLGSDGLANGEVTIVATSLRRIDP